MRAGRASRRPAVAARVAALLLLVAGATGASPARADESPIPTAQQVAYGGEWLPYVDPADLPPVEERPVVCLVDSGVAITSDLPADRPEGPIVSRRTLVEGAAVTGDPTPEGQHGTRMASMMGAVANGVGTVGAVPWVRVVSVRAMVPGETTFRGGEYRRGVDYCANDVAFYEPVAAIALSLGCECELIDAERTATSRSVSRARDRRAVVLAAAGNHGGQALQTPANIPGVVPVAAGDASGAPCAYATAQPGVVLGPGCGIDTAEAERPVRSDSGGSSAAAAFAASVVAALRTFRAGASADEVEAWVRAGRGESGALDVTAAFRAAGLDDIVLRAQDRMPRGVAATGHAPASEAQSAPNPAAPDPSPAPRPTAERVPMPRARATVRGRHVVLTVRNRPRGVIVNVRAEVLRGFAARPLRTVRRRSGRLRFSTSTRPSRLVIWFSVPAPSRSVSPREYLSPSARGVFA